FYTGLQTAARLQLVSRADPAAAAQLETFIGAANSGMAAEALTWLRVMADAGQDAAHRKAMFESLVKRDGSGMGAGPWSQVLGKLDERMNPGDATLRQVSRAFIRQMDSRVGNREWLQWMAVGIFFDEVEYERAMRAAVTGNPWSYVAIELLKRDGATDK